MEQISLEEKVNNTLKWLANQIACTQVYKKWDEEFKKESLDLYFIFQRAVLRNSSEEICLMTMSQ